MKKLRILLMLFLIVTTSGSTIAKGILDVEIIPVKKEKTEVDVHTVPNVPIVVQLEDGYGSVLYSDKEKPATFDYKKIYDFSNLDDGNYTFIVKVGNENSLKNLVVKNGTVQITGQKEELSPDFKLDGKFLEFTFPNIDDKDTRILLYDKDNGYWVYQESLLPKYDIKQALNLSKLDSGNYMAVLISGKNVYNYDFKLN
ncbi:hypothetical protein [Maribellus sediminis]|uniref:hypothetical protein n=1 Tax=Maribellus sediminis TaxID=2696285 RepID=UPI00143081C6|nr:hypothetical protein [Maribellus sediminis]